MPQQVTKLIQHVTAGVSGDRATQIVNILAEEPKVVASWLVPRIRGVTGNGKYFK